MSSFPEIAIGLDPNTAKRLYRVNPSHPEKGWGKGTPKALPGHEIPVIEGQSVKLGLPELPGLLPTRREVGAVIQASLRLPTEAAGALVSAGVVSAFLLAQRMNGLR